MSRTGQWVLEQQLANPHETMMAEMHVNDYSPHDFAIAQPEWHTVLGECLELIYRALGEQNGTEQSAFFLYHRAENLAVDVIACQREKTLVEAYRELGYDMDTEQSNELPF